MKNLKFLFVLAIVFYGQLMFAQSKSVDVKKTEIKWTGKKIVGEHIGNILLKSGEFELKEDILMKADFVIDMTSITNLDLKDVDYNQKLVGHLKSDDFFGVDTYPIASFILAKPAKFINGKATVKGNLTIKGISNPISFVITREKNIYSAKIDVDRSKFNIRYGSKSFFNDIGDKAIDDIFSLDIKIFI